MLQVIQVTRCFGSRTALNEVSFEAVPGDIIALLGHNGAGKTTLLRLAACYLQPTAGTIRLHGLDTFRDSLDFRRITGYLPERSPLYDDMTVSEYLYFRGRIKGLSTIKARRRVRDLISQLGLEDVSRRLISGLSFGTRRRVGVVDALLHEPKLLVLDDPLANVDPIEARHLTEAIGAAARHAIVLVSGHTLEALGALCTRYMVLRDGRLSAQCSRHALETSGQGSTLEIEVTHTSDAALRRFATPFAGAEKVSLDLLPDGWWHVSWPVTAGVDVRDRVMAEIVRQGWSLRSLRCTTPGIGARLAKLVAGDAPPVDGTRKGLS